MHPITVSIIPFAPEHQPGVDAMLDSIVPEYAESFFHQPVKKIADLYLLPGRAYWVAIADGKVVGSVGVILADEYAILKSLFVSKEFRGETRQVAHRLMQTATEKAKQHGCNLMYLGTMAQFTAAQKFYEKLGYSRVAATELPAGFPHNALDSVFYYIAL